MKHLAQGRQDFKGIIEENLLYVDKTQEIYELISLPTKYFFFSRPRRFGKSLLISTLKYLFQGSKDLFKGLYIEDKYDFEVFPVIHLDFSYGISNRNAELLRNSLNTTLDEISETYKVVLSESTLEKKFAGLIESLYQKTGKQVVILIDEYDKAITDNLDNVEVAEENRKVLRELFSGMKNADQYLRLLFMTGVSRFAKMSIFSVLNNMTDISLNPNFHNLVGFKPEDIEAYFGEYLQILQTKFKIDKNTLLKVIQKKYNGYSWDGIQRLYNPYSLTNAFYNQKLDNYWFQSGTPNFLIDLMRTQQTFIPDLDAIESSLMFGDSENLSHLDLSSVLFQTGYLTIDSIELPLELGWSETYYLAFPNEEVKSSMYNYLLADKANLYVNEVMPKNIQIKKALNKQDMKVFLNILKATFAKIPARLHLKAEAYYHSLFYMLLYLLGSQIKLEEEQAIGRVDVVLETEEFIYIIEFKYGDKTDMDKLLMEAMTQIKEKKYYEPYLADKRQVLLLAVGFLGKEEIDLSLEELNR